jgi:hypothetical protein
MKAVLVCLFSLVAMGTCRAGVIYTFTGTTAPALPPVSMQAFQYGAAGFIPASSTLSLVSTQLDSCLDCIAPPVPAVFFVPDECAESCFDLLSFNGADNIQYEYYFPLGSFDSPGVHTSIVPPGVLPASANSGTLTVTPEPSTGMPGMAGIPAMLLLWRRRRR